MVFGNKIDCQELTGIKIAFVISFYLIYHEGEAWMDTTIDKWSLESVDL